MARARHGLTKRLPWAGRGVNLPKPHFSPQHSPLCLPAGLTLEFICVFPWFRQFVRAAQISLFLPRLSAGLPRELQLGGSVCGSGFRDGHPFPALLSLGFQAAFELFPGDHSLCLWRQWRHRAGQAVNHLPAAQPGCCHGPIFSSPLS